MTPILKLRLIVSTSFVVILFITACVNYKRVNLTQHAPFEHRKLGAHFRNYNIYVKDSLRTYRLVNPSISDKTILGTVEALSTKEEQAVLKDDRVRGKNDHKYDLLIYTNKPVDTSLPNPTSNNLEASIDTSLKIVQDRVSVDKSQFSLTEKDIDKVSVFALDENDVSKFILLIVLGALALVLLIWGLAALSSNGSGGSNSGGSNSGGSNSGGSNSGGSNSGGSTSGGSGGSCYIATMAYGSYDAPEVIILRNFRDQYLKKYKYGRQFICWYYRNSPKFVRKYQQKTGIHALIRIALNAVVKILKRKYA